MEHTLIPLAGMAIGVILVYPIVRTAVRLVERRFIGGATPSKELAEVREDLHALHDRLDALEQGDSRVAELEERVDFAERMLAQQRETPRLGGE
jgi:hypothetical protein